MSVSRTKTSFSWTRIPRDPSTSNSDDAASPAVLAQTGKRDRDDGMHAFEHCIPSISFSGDDDDGDSPASSACRPTKRLCTNGSGLMSFYKPHPCAFHVPCRFRATCSYHHGVAEPCDCNYEDCPCGHAHRRAPRACHHGQDCRWKMLGECSFHHGNATPCSCHDLTCPKAHLERTTKQEEIRQQIYGTAKDRKAQKARKQLYFVFPKSKKPNHIQKDVIHKTIRQAIQIATNNSSLEGQEDPVQEVMHNTGERYGFISFRTPAMATACLAHLNGLLIPNTGRIKLDRTKYYSPAPVDDDNDGGVGSGGEPAESILPFFDTSQLDIVQNKTKKKKGKKSKAKQKKDNSERVTMEPETIYS